MTQIELAKKGIISPQMKLVAQHEEISEELILQYVAEGKVVIPANPFHKAITPYGIGKDLTIKINANIGASSDYGDVESELAKMRVAIQFGAHAVMDLSTRQDLSSIRKSIIKESSVPIGTVPIYQVGIEAVERSGAIINMTVDDIFSVLEQQAYDGVDFMTLHCGITQAAIAHLKEEHRVTDVVSRGGAFMIGWMLHHQKENPLYEYFDRLLELARKFDITLSLGDGMRPGSLADATDRAQIQELITLGELVDRARQG